MRSRIRQPITLPSRDSDDGDGGEEEGEGDKEGDGEEEEEEEEEEEARDESEMSMEASWLIGNPEAFASSLEVVGSSSGSSGLSDSG